MKKQWISNGMNLRSSHLRPSASLILLILTRGVLPMLYSTLGMMPMGGLLRKNGFQ